MRRVSCSRAILAMSSSFLASFAESFSVAHASSPMNEPTHLKPRREALQLGVGVAQRHHGREWCWGDPRDRLHHPTTSR